MSSHDDNRHAAETDARQAARRGASRRTLHHRRPESHQTILVAETAEDAWELAEEGFLQPRPFWRDWTWLGLTLLAALAFGLAYWGSPGEDWHHKARDAIRLFPSGFPGLPEKGTSVQTQIAQHLAPFVALFLTLRIVIEVWSRQTARLKARLRRRPVIVCGIGEKGFRAANGFLDQRKQVTCLTLDAQSDAAAHLRARGAIVLEDDATHDTSLRAAAVRRATDVVCACGSDAVTAAVASRVSHLVRGRRGTPTNVWVHIADPDFAHTLRVASLAVPDVRLSFFNIYEQWADALLERGLTGRRAEEPDPPRLLVLGASELGTTLVVRAARRWHANGAAPRSRILLTLVDPEAESVCATLQARYPALSRCADLVAAERPLTLTGPPDLAKLMPSGRGSGLAYICLADEAAALGLALRTRQVLGETGTRVLVPASAWTAGLKGFLLPADDEITAVPYSGRPNSLDLLEDSVREAIAREVHETYRSQLARREDEAQRPADRPWAELAGGYRESSRLHVDEMLLQLRSLFLEAAPLLDWDEEPLRLSEEQIETLARLEHDRWYRERRGADWERGAEGAAARLVPWEGLGDDMRRVNLRLAERRPALLAQAGCRLVYRPERELLAQRLHERYVGDRTRRGEAASHPSLRGWEELPPVAEQRELSLTAADAAASKLALAGYRTARAADVPGVSRFAFTPTEIERLAELEHDRWRRVREIQGWRRGTRRDEEERTHPDLVPWAELPEARRQIDRDQIVALPALLESIGLVVVPLDSAP